MKYGVQKLIALLALTICLCNAELPPGGSNNYLPPSNNGYNYDRPPVSFPNNPTRPSFPSSPPPSFRPSQPTYQPPPPPPSYQPSPSPFQPSRPQPTYPSQPPSYYPSTPAYRPPSPTPPIYTPPPSQPTFRPSYQPPTSSYRPPPPSSYGPPISGDGSGINNNHLYPDQGGHDHSHDHHEPGMPFEINYAVKEDAYGNDYSHNAISDGDVTRGEYRTLLPDGRTQVVKYTADWKNGYNAEVTYEGEAKFGNYPGGGPTGGGYQPGSGASGVIPQYGPPPSNPAIDGYRY